MSAGWLWITWAATVVLFGIMLINSPASVPGWTRLTIWLVGAGGIAAKTVFTGRRD